MIYKEIWIKNIIGKVLEPAGFFYMGSWKGESYEGISIFQRKIKNSRGETITQEVMLQDHGYDSIILNLETEAAGHMNYRINDFVPDCDCTRDRLYFETEEECKEVIEQFADILMKYGLPFLEKIKEPKMKYYITYKDYETLFYHHKELVHHIVKREKVKIEELDVEKAAEWIEKKIQEEKEKTFEEVRTLLLELSALFGAVVNQYSPCEWNLREDFGCRLNFSNPQNNRNTINIVNMLFWEWSNLRPEASNILPEWEEWEEKKYRERMRNIDAATAALIEGFIDLNFSKYVQPTLKEKLLSAYQSCIQAKREIQP